MKLEDCIHINVGLTSLHYRISDAAINAMRVIDQRSEVACEMYSKACVDEIDRIMAELTEIRARAESALNAERKGRVA